MPYDPNDERWREYHVTPRYLAGSTFTGDPAIRPLLDAGWNLTHDEMGNAYVNAPDQTVRLGYLPEGDDDALWKITGYSDPFTMPRWLVTYQDSTPTEIVQGFTTALAAAYAEGPNSYLYYGNSELAALDVGTPLAAAGWSHRYGAADVSFESPDGLAEVHLRRDHLDHAVEMTGRKERWLTLAGPRGNRWYATASSFTPEGLVAAMNTALTDPAPVIRYGDDLRRLPPQATAIPVRPPVPTPLDVRRALAANARSTMAPSPADARLFIPAPRPPSAPQTPRPGHSR
ncbi:DUF317 domain-containing protein [Streptomyces canus]|uniref:DUF317 domain-containing protein n=1 Tax=Streptomyces canus TaxID=58343 RepID=UPI002252B3AB|nr:DUF317 domain-containing protein [Streptomyces canus]MCX4858213.1 DUF317 domain-containing protein [Streptomyces canus]